MKTTTLMNIIFFIISFNLIHHRIYSYRLSSPKMNMNNGMEPYLIDDTSLPNDENIIPSPFERRSSDSAEKYFNWASKTNRPLEYFRGKRFWLFTKKDDQTNNQESMPGAHLSASSVRQGIWRSGIVGRRRRST